jgi:DHA2 family multidrug resistance protein
MNTKVAEQTKKLGEAGALTLLLTNRLVQDPPSFDAERASVRHGGKLSVDGMGIALIALASATLEVALDRGQIEGWFASRFICWMLALALFGWIATVIWEMRVTEPVIDFRLLANRNFAISNVLFFVFGVGLFGSTTLIPQILQSLYGYCAIDAGLVLGPGALVITALAPIGAQLIQRKIVHPRYLVMFSFSVLAPAQWHYSTFTLATDYRHYVLARAFQGLGYGFFFVSLNIIAYSQLRPDQNNRASSLLIFRNWGGSFGIALITTVAERRQQFHQTNVGSALAATSQQLTARSTKFDGLPCQ